MANRIDLLKGLIRQSDIKTFSRRGDKRQAAKLLTQIKRIFNEVLREKDDEIFQQDIIRMFSSEAANPYISSNFFPQDMKEYGRYRNIIDFTSDLQIELRWMAYCFKFYSKKISEFITEREKYDNYILLNKYEDALKVIENVEKMLGSSLWSLECKFYLYAKMNLNTNELMKEAPKLIFGAIMNFYELKNRDNVTSDEYFYIANKEINNAKKYIADAESLMEFYAYKITSLVYEMNEEKILQILWVMRQTSLIDRYLFFCDVCDYIVTLPEDNELRLIFVNYILSA